MSEELRECPHCGATRGLYTLDEYGGLCVDDDLIAQIFCDNCKSAFENESANNGKELIEAWNTRAERTCEVTEYNDCGPHAEDCTIVLTCGHRTLGYIPNYCPSCGAKVVS